MLRSAAMLLCLAGVSAVVQVDFERHLRGKSSTRYTDAMAKADWGGVQYTTADRHKMATVVRDGGSAVLRVKYPKGCYGTKCALQIKATGDYAGDEVWGSFRLKFESGFDFRRGGKLPGFCGGDCVTGCRKRTGYNGWSARSMWRGDGRAVGYMYVPDDAPRCGANWDWSKRFATGRWHTVQYHLKLNSVSGGRARSDGVMQTWLDGDLVLDRTKVVFRYNTKQLADKFYFSTFHGGGDSSWAPTRDSYIRFDDFRLSNAPLGTPTLPAPLPPPPRTPSPRSPPQPPSPPAGVVSGEEYKVVSRASGKVLDVDGFSKRNGASVQQWSWAQGANQRWIVTDMGRGRYQLRSVHSRKCVDVRRSSKRNGARVHQWGCGSQANKMFHLRGVGGGYYELRATHSGKCVSIDPRRATRNGADAEQQTCNGAKTQHFRFDRIGSSPASPPAARPSPPAGPPSGCSSIREWGSCRHNPGCCKSGLSCYEKSRWYAQCRKDCKGKSSWTCKVLG